MYPIDLSSHSLIIIADIVLFDCRILFVYDVSVCLGKTLLARAVANATEATYIRVIGSELVQKYVGEGARMVRELFQMARSKKAWSAEGTTTSICNMNVYANVHYSYCCPLIPLMLTVCLDCFAGLCWLLLCVIVVL